MSNQENKALPAILVGGAPDAGKSVLTYHLSQQLREKEVPHYVLRANPDGEGDWFLEGNDIETVRQLRKQAHTDWSDEFRQFVCRAIANRSLPLIVDIGGLPREEDVCILSACTHSILLLKDGEEQANETWRYFTTRTGLNPFAELRSVLNGRSELAVQGPVLTLTGTISGLERRKPLRNEVFNELARRTKKLFTFSEFELERMHQDQAPVDAFPVYLLRYLRRFAPGEKEWNLDLLEQFLPEVRQQSSQTPLAVYGRGPNWLYGILSVCGDLRQPFYQFDPRFCPSWIQALDLQASASVQTTQEFITLETRARRDAWMLTMLLKLGYVDYEREAGTLVLPEPPPGQGVILNGKLPLWLFTSLARFYARRNAPWVAFNYARENRAFVVYSRVETYRIGDTVPLPV